MLYWQALRLREDRRLPTVPLGYGMTLLLQYRRRCCNTTAAGTTRPHLEVLRESAFRRASHQLVQDVEVALALRGTAQSGRVMAISAAATR